MLGGVGGSRELEVLAGAPGCICHVSVSDMVLQSAGWNLQGEPGAFQERMQTRCPEGP